MGNFLIAKLSLTLGKGTKTQPGFMVTIKEKLPAKLQPGKPGENKKTATAFMIPWVRKAFQEGVKYAKVDAKARGFPKADRKFSIDEKLKGKLLEEFLYRIRAAGAVYRTEIDNYRGLKKLHPGVTKQKDPQVEQIWKRYINAVLGACNNLLLNAGAAGTMAVYREVENDIK